MSKLKIIAQELAKLLEDWHAITKNGDDGNLPGWMPLIRKVRALAKQAEAITELPPSLETIIQAGPHGNGIGMHTMPAEWKRYADELHKHTREWLATVQKEGKDEATALEKMTPWQAKMVRYLRESGGAVSLRDAMRHFQNMPATPKKRRAFVVNINRANNRFADFKIPYELEFDRKTKEIKLIDRT